MTDKEFNNIKDLILSDNEEDNILGVNIIKSLGGDNTVILDALRDNEGFISNNKYEKYFKYPWSYGRDFIPALKDKYNE